MGDGGGGYAARLFLLFSFPCSADHERDWPPCKVVFFGLATNTLNVRNNNNNNINSAARQECATLIIFVHYAQNYRQTPHRYCCGLLTPKFHDSPGKRGSYDYRAYYFKHLVLSLNKLFSKR